MATHSSVLAWRIPGTGEPGGLPSMRSHRVGHDWSDLAAAAAILNLSLEFLELRLPRYWSTLDHFGWRDCLGQQVYINKYRLSSRHPDLCWWVGCCCQSLSPVGHFWTPWTATWQASLSFTISQS